MAAIDLNPLHPADPKYWRREGDRVTCTLCAHLCKIPEGKPGVCGVRVNRANKLYTLIYQRPGSIALDPIEKKPLFHFYPGSQVLSFGAPGCNLGCVFCQNSCLSQVSPGDIPQTEVKAEILPRLCEQKGARGCAWTYNEPTIWHEWTMECMRELKKAGYYSVYVSNGFITEEPQREAATLLDAVNVDVKAFTEQYYRRITKSRLQPVLDACVRYVELGIHLELTYLMIPTLNDNPEEVRKFCRWVVDELGDEVPVHFSRFHPDYKLMHLPNTPMQPLITAHRIAKDEGVKFPYVGNVEHGDYENTYCPNCGTLLIERSWFRVRFNDLDGSRCRKCKASVPIVGEPGRQVSASPVSLF